MVTITSKSNPPNDFPAIIPTEKSTGGSTPTPTPSVYIPPDPGISTVLTRPANPKIGEVSWDSDLNRPVWWRGANWVDAYGNVVQRQFYSDARALVDATAPAFKGEMRLPYTNGFDFYRDTIEADYAIQTTPDQNLWKFTCNPGDGNSAGKTTDRSELVGRFSYQNPSKKNNTVPWGRRVCQAFSQRFSGTLSTNQAHFCVVGQWHGSQPETDASLSPPLAFNFAGDSFRITKLYDPNEVQTNSTNTNFQGIWYDTSDKIPFNTWIHWYLEVVFDYNNPGKGSIFIMKNGKVIVDLQNTSVGFNDPLGPRYQFGLYRSQNYPTSMSVEYANMEIGYDTSIINRAYSPREITRLA